MLMSTTQYAGVNTCKLYIKSMAYKEDYTLL